MTSSKRKGKHGELEVANILKTAGYDAHRGVQYQGGTDSPDVIGLPGYHLEVKRTEAGSKALYAWREQAEADAGVDKTPVVVHRQNGQPWVAILSLDDFLHLVRYAGLVPPKGTT